MWYAVNEYKKGVLADLISVFLRIALLLFLTALPFVLGRGLLAVLYGRQRQELYMADDLLTGWIVCIGLAEAAHLTAVFLGQRFSGVVRLFCAGLVLMTILAVAVLLYGRHAGKKSKKGKKDNSVAKEQAFDTIQVILFLLFMILAVLQLVSVNCSGNVYRTGDMTVETVESFLKTDSVYQVNPLTGRAYTEGIPLRIKILCLPTLYGAISRIFGLSAEQVVWNLIPTVVLTGSYLAYYLLASIFFPGQRGRRKRMIFMIFVALLFWVGDYQYGMDGFGILYSGFRGVTIRNAILLPYTFGLVLRRRYRSVALCILAEGCIVWTLYGAGMCLLGLAALGAVLLYKERGATAGKGAEP